MKAKDAGGLVLIVLALGLVGGSFYAGHRLKAPKIDPQTLCPLSGPTGVTWVLIDKTDPLSKVERVLIQDTVGKERARLAQGEEITIAVLEQQADVKTVATRPVLRLCNPGATADPLFQNPKRIEETYRLAFAAPMSEALGSVMQNGSAPSSPIVKSLSNALEDDALANTAHPRLVLITDLLEHSELGSAYEGSFTATSLTKALGPSQLVTLHKAVIEVVILTRPKLSRSQTKAKAVWQTFLETHAAQFSIH